ncbi:hypothetical protein DID88_004291 [Monilinia fructigena]|uniref:RRM domain-containing protein n=1 Tax=Monilinia fructigena TaxID=38457 RepID=A0A395IUW8_9HELO|nr:hypothetical protein DID88_004291 [Monilinia fructigena]
MSFQQQNYDPAQQGGYEQNNGNGAMPPLQPCNNKQQQQGGIPAGDGGSPAPFAQQGAGVEGSSGSVAGDAKTTLWMGELEPWIDENFIRSVWFGMGEQVNVKMIRDKFSGNAGYCFIDFASPAAAAKALSLNGSMIPNTSRPLSLIGHQVVVLPIVVTTVAQSSLSLLAILAQRSTTKIMTDPISGMSRGYGFVRFAEEGDQQRALTDMQGVFCGNRPMRISTATPKNKSGGAGTSRYANAGRWHFLVLWEVPQALYGMGGGPPMAGYYGAPQPMNQFTDPNNTTVLLVGPIRIWPATQQQGNGYNAGYPQHQQQPSAGQNTNSGFNNQAPYA